MASGRRLVRALAAGEYVTPDALEPAQNSTLWQRRQEQDSIFSCATKTARRFMPQQPRKVDQWTTLRLHEGNER
jgi:hypothetical protein